MAQITADDDKDTNRYTVPRKGYLYLYLCAANVNKHESLDSAAWSYGDFKFKAILYNKNGDKLKTIVDNYSTYNTEELVQYDFFTVNKGDYIEITYTRNKNIPKAAVNPHNEGSIMPGTMLIYTE